VAVALSSPGVPVEALGEPEPDPRALEEERRHRLESEIAFLREQIDVLTARLAETEARAQAAEQSLPADAPAPDADELAELRAEVDKARAERDTARERLTDERDRRAAAEAAYDNARIARDSAQHELSHVREELEARQVELPSEPASGTVVVPAPPPAPIHRDEPAPLVQAIEAWFPRFALAVFGICVVLLLIGAIKVI
jgi:multidrug efflux pump subunit AcrA (membrane-fusion protein)